MKRITVLFVGVLGACSPSPENAPSGPEITVTQPQATGPQLQYFSLTDSTAATVVEGAGCFFTSPGVEGDSSLFASSVEGIIRVQDKIEIVKLVADTPGNDTTERWENDRYRIDLQTVTDSMLEGGVLLHGTLRLTDKQTGAQSETQIKGNCGC